MSKTINEVRAEILKEFGIDVSTDVIRRDQAFGLYEVPRDENNNFRQFSDEAVERIKLIALLRQIGIEREDIKKIVVEGKKEIAWEKMNHLTNVAIPMVKGRL